MFRIVGGLVESGMAVVLISSDLAEVMHMSHRVAVLPRRANRREEPAGRSHDLGANHATTDGSLGRMKTAKQMLAAARAPRWHCCCSFASGCRAFSTSENMLDLAQQVSVNAILAFGMTLAILIGGIDLSVGALLALVGTTTVYVLTLGDSEVTKQCRWLMLAVLAGSGWPWLLRGLQRRLCGARTDAALHHHAGDDAGRPRAGPALQRRPPDAHPRPRDALSEPGQRATVRRRSGARADHARAVRCHGRPAAPDALRAVCLCHGRQSRSGPLHRRAAVPCRSPRLHHLLAADGRRRE